MHYHSLGRVSESALVDGVKLVSIEFFNINITLNTRNYETDQPTTKLTNKEMMFWVIHAGLKVA